MRLWLNNYQDELSRSNEQRKKQQYSTRYWDYMISKARNFEGILFDWDMTLAQAMGDVGHSIPKIYAVLDNK